MDLQPSLLLTEPPKWALNIARKPMPTPPSPANQLTIGRGTRASIRLPSDQNFFSRIHCTLFWHHLGPAAPLLPVLTRPAHFQRDRDVIQHERRRYGMAINDGNGGDKCKWHARSSSARWKRSFSIVATRERER
jgi:hypothetical protein